MIRWRWLRVMYVYTAVVAGGFGLAMVLAPLRMQSILGMPAQDPVTFGLNGSILLSFGLAAIAGVRAPLKYSAVLLLELVYKLIWLLGVVVPLVSQGKFPTSAIVQVVIFLTFVLGDLVAIPFRYMFAGDIESDGPGDGKAP